MRKVGILGLVISLSLVLAGFRVQAAEDFPKKPIRVIIPYSAGGGTDVLGRAFQTPFDKALGVKTIIDCIPAGSTKVGTMEGMKAKPDGYTLILMPMEAWIGYYYSKSYDLKVWEKLTPVGSITEEPYGFLEARTDSPFKTWAELVKYAKENPGKVTCAGGGSGGVTEMIYNEITKAAGISCKYVPFAGAGPTKIALLGGHVDFRICQPSEAITMIRAGKTRGLAISTEKRFGPLPDIPTFKELGIGFSIGMHRGFWGPANLPAPVVNTVAKAIEKATKDPELVNIVEDKLIYKVSYFSGQWMKEEMSRFDERFGPKLAALFK